MPLTITRCEVDKENQISTVFDVIILGLSSSDIELCISKLSHFESHFSQLNIAYATVENIALLQTFIQNFHEKNIITIVIGQFYDKETQWSSFFSELFVFSNTVDFNILEATKAHFLGYQRHLVSIENIATVEAQSDYSASLGMINLNVDHIEPLLRNAGHLLVNLNICKSSFFDIQDAQPTGIEPETLIQLVRFSTNSTSLKTIFLQSDNLPKHGTRDSSLTLMAEIIWYVLEGISIGPCLIDDDSYITFCALKDYDIDLEFTYDPNCGKYWVRIYDENDDENSTLHPCTYAEFEEASQGQLSSRLIKLLLH